MGRPLTHDLLGQTFGELTVIARSQRKAPYPYWVCRCTCGRTVDVASTNLRFGHSRSCGCRTKEWASAALKGKNTTHGLTQGGVIPKEYEVWRGMLRRCYESDHPAYKNYGARGIRVCARWRDFGNFYKDMGPRPSTKHSLDRRDNSKGYNPDNCRWATWRVQANNKRSNRRITFDGRTQNLSEWSREVGLGADTLCRRLEFLGWSVERALTTPVIPPKLRRAHISGPSLG
jgi:hypothetical protein